MYQWEGSRKIAVVTACMSVSGLPQFVLNEVEVTAEEAANGVHYYLVEADLQQGGYEEPYTHFDQFEAPAFLHPAVRRLASSVADSSTVTLLEEHKCA